MVAAMTALIPAKELPPGAMSFIRNNIIRGVLALASRELRMPEEKLVVRDVRPFGDLQMYSLPNTTTDATSERWGVAATNTTLGYMSVTGEKIMGDERFVALFGARDRIMQQCASGSATLAVAMAFQKPVISFIKINVGGGDKVLWDLTSMYAYDEAVGISPSAVLIPQNNTFNISYYRQGNIDAGVTLAPVAQEIAWIQLMGVTVEPRGILISP